MGFLARFFGIVLISVAAVHAQPQAPRLVSCSSTAALVQALDQAQAGDQIVLEPGVYQAPGTREAFPGRTAYFVASASGSPHSPIVLSSRDPARPAILAGANFHDPGYVLHLLGKHWQVKNLVIRIGQKGVMIDRAESTTLTEVEVSDVGHEGIHVRDGSLFTTLDRVWVHDTGKKDAGFGEGIYIGSDRSAWDVNQGEYNRAVRHTIVRHSTVGPGVTAELIDIKEGSSQTEIFGNKFLGSGIAGILFADSFVDNKGVQVTLRDNVGYREFNDRVKTDYSENNRTFSNPWCPAEETANGDLVDLGDGNRYLNNVTHPGFEDPAKPRPQVTPAPAQAVLPPSSNLVLSPVEDLYTRSSAPDILKNESKIQVKQTHTLGAFLAASPADQAKMDLRIGYLKFLVPAQATFQRAVLRLYAQSATNVLAGATVGVYQPLNDNPQWTQLPDSPHSLTWRTQPGLGAKLAEVAVPSINAYYEWDVTAYARDRQAAGQPLTLVVADEAATGAYYAFFDTKNQTNAPQLVLE